MCDILTLQFLIKRNIQAFNKNNIANIANKELLDDNYKTW